jgi:uncharacterized protein YijF (DUF1287 family)
MESRLADKFNDLSTELKMKKIIAVFLVCLSVWPVAMAQTPDSIAKSAFTKRLVAAATARAQVPVRYVSAYVKLSYPNGDVPSDTGVCTDEIIRSYRNVGIDLQKEVHEDMLLHLTAYPLHGARADSNIDHRRVPNLQKFFERHGSSLPVTQNADDYKPGDLVTWSLSGGKYTHIGIVVNRMNKQGRYEILHNIGEGPKIEDVLFDWKITGHYRYFGPTK